MTTAKIFYSGNSQAVRLPKEFRLDGVEVEIYRRDNEIVLRPIAGSGVAIFDALADLSSATEPYEDFSIQATKTDVPQEREPF